MLVFIVPKAEFWYAYLATLTPPLAHMWPSLAERWSSSSYTAAVQGRKTITIMPTQSVPIRDPALPSRLLLQYLHLLKKYPIITKSVTRSVGLFINSLKVLLEGFGVGCLDETS